MKVFSNLQYLRVVAEFVGVGGHEGSDVELVEVVISWLIIEQHFQYHEHYLGNMLWHTWLQDLPESVLVLLVVIKVCLETSGSELELFAGSQHLHVSQTSDDGEEISDQVMSVESRDEESQADIIPGGDQHSGVTPTQLHLVPQI